MSKFIKIKNETGDGDMLLKTGLIFRVYDKSDGGANIVYGGKPEGATVFKTASTAAEVLAAIEESRKPEPSEYKLRDGLRSFYYASPAQAIMKRHPTQFSVAGSIPMTEPAKEVVGRGLCLCKEIAGDNRECPMHHLPTLPDCTCRNLISGHDPDCPWHGG